MMPLYKARTLTGDMLLSPFEIFIYLPEKELEEQEERLKKVWDELDCVTSVFNLKFISKENLIEDDPYLESVFEHNNIFARILMPLTGDRIGIEIGWMDVYTSREVFLKGDLLRFVYYLCKKGLEQVQQMKIDTEFFARDSRGRDERLFYIAELERRLIRINENIISQEEVELRLFLADKRCYKVMPNLDYLTEDFEANKQKLGNTDIDSLPIQELAALVGFDVPQFNEDNVGGKASSFYDPSVSISVVQRIQGSTLPGLRSSTLPGLRIGIGKKNIQHIDVPTKSREGIFAYVCTLIRYKNGKSFGKKDLSDFLKELEKYSTYKVLSEEEPEEPTGLLESEKEVKKHKKINKIRHYHRGVVIFGKMPASLLKEYEWFRKIYDALFRIGRSFDHVAERSHVGGMNFEQWCIHVLYDDIKEPFRQGISNERSVIREKLTKRGYGTIVNQVGLLNREKRYYIDVDPDNIHFPPNDELWEEALSYARDMDSDFME